MKVMLAFDSFKGALTAPEACAIAAHGIKRLSPEPAVVLCPLSDGGEGFADAMRLAGQGTVYPLAVTGPVGEPVRAEVALLDHGRTAVVESAQACGLGLVPAGKRTPLQTTTYGVGQMLAQAAALGASDIVVGLGGSATNDAGIGMLSALGWRFLDAQGQAVSPVGASLEAIIRIEPGLSLAGVRIVAACDVRNPLYGPDGAAAVYGPQKGASPAEVARLDAGLRHFAALCADVLGRDCSQQPGAGAAGGLGFALLAFLGAEFRPGAELAIALTGLDAHLAGADLCLTGEGRTDRQTAAGKLPAAVAAHCQRAGVPCVCLSGALGDGWRELYACGFTALFSIAQRPQTLRQAIREGRHLLADAAEAVARLAAR